MQKEHEYFQDMHKRFHKMHKDHPGYENDMGNGVSRECHDQGGVGEGPPASAAKGVIKAKKTKKE